MKIGFLSYHYGGLDGVGLTDRWLKKGFALLGHEVILIAGKISDQSPGYQIPLLYHHHPQIHQLYLASLYPQSSEQELRAMIFALGKKILRQLREIIKKEKIEMLFGSNLLSIAMNYPAGWALDQLLQGEEIRILARHCDFWWERGRYLSTPLKEFLQQYFPPLSPLLRHLVINSLSQRSLWRRKKIKAAIIPDFFDFNYQLDLTEEKKQYFARNFLLPQNLVILQPSRIVRRKRVDRGIILAAYLRRFKKHPVQVLITGAAGDEPGNFLQKVEATVKKYRVPTTFLASKLAYHYGQEKGETIYPLFLTYEMADLIFFLSEVEGFGNQVVETFFFRKPLVINSYKVYEEDIRPLGFRCLEIDNGNITPEILDHLDYLLEHRSYCQEMVEHNFQLAREHFSLEKNLPRLQDLLEWE